MPFQHSVKVPHVHRLWRYPVKSLRGEELTEVDVETDGIAGDRLVHVREPNGRVVTSRYRPGLLGLNATLGSDGEPLIEGLPWRDERSLAAVRAASAPDVDLVRFVQPDRGQRHDVLPLTILTDGMGRALDLDYRRFRPNVLISGVEGLGERAWVGRALAIGSTLIGVQKARPRCVMTTFDPVTLEQDPSVLRRIVAKFDRRVALDCWVLEPGRIGRGDTVEVVELPRGVQPPVGNAAQ
jgi:MOSC domain-containing protein